MSTSIENLRKLSAVSLKDHIGIFDFYVVLGRDIEKLSIKFGLDINMIVCLLEGYGEKIIKDDGSGDFDTSGKGRLSKLHRVLVEEYVTRFYPGIAAENPQNDWICIESYLDKMHQGWR